MSSGVSGIHHVTAIGGEPIGNLDFYTRVLGLRLLKRTVNFDDPGTWHLYFGDRLGRPGTVMTFFPHPRARPGRPGSREVARTAFAVPIGTLDAWLQRLEREGLPTEKVDEAGRRGLNARDPHGTRLALVEVPGAEGVEPWTGGDVPATEAIRGFESVRLNVRKAEPTVGFLVEFFGAREVNRSGDRRWFEIGNGQRVEVAASADPPAQLGAGSVHHVAFRVADDGAQVASRRRLADAGFGVTEIKDRQYFRSIYFREPGGVIFEIATDGPGFAVDEPEEELGQKLKLPPWLEPHRTTLERSLPLLSREASS